MSTDPSNGQPLESTAMSQQPTGHLPHQKGNRSIAVNASGPELQPATGRPQESASAQQPPYSAPAAERVLFTPPIDIYDGEEGLVLIADLPGVSLETLDLQVQDNKLSLLGRVPRSAPEGARLVHKEYDEGDFLRSFILSEEVNHERITAKLNNGVLEVVLPRVAKSPPRRIQVQSE